VNAKQGKKHLPYLLSIVFFAAIFRLAFFFQNPQIIINIDTFSYYKIAQLIAKDGFRYFMNTERTSLYPVVLNLATQVTGHYQAAVESPEFYLSMGLLLLFQSTLGLMSLIILYKILVLIKVKTIPAYLYTLFIAGNIMVFGWERLLLTESLSVFWLIMTTYLLILILKNPKNQYFLVLTILFLLGFLLKPFYLLFPIVVYFIILLHHHRKKIVIACFLSLLLFYAFVAFYIQHNQTYFGNATVSRNGDINLLGKILQFRLPIEAASSEEYFYQKVKDYYVFGGDPMPYRFLDNCDPDIYDKAEMMRSLRRFNRKVILANLPQYLSQSTKQLPSALLESSELLVFPDAKTGFLNYFISFLYQTYRKFQILTLAVFPFYFLSLLVWSKKNDFTDTVLALLGTIAVYQILISVFLSYGEFGRLIAPVQPILYFFCFWWYWYLVKKIIHQ